VVKQRSQRWNRNEAPAGQPVRLHPVPRTRTGRGLRHGVSLLPSLFTIANLFCGWACVVHAMRGEFIVAAPFIGVAIVLDMLDGRIARMTGTTSDFGVQLDSLADLISFGMAPAILAFQWGLVPLGRMGWAVGFVFLTAAALRLARFNIQTVSDKRYFVGLPSPAAAAIPASTIFYYPQGLHIPQQALLGMAMMVVPALLMVSTIRFRSFKTIDMGQRRGYQVLIGVAGFLALVVTYPHEVLILMAYAYLLSGFIGLIRSRFRPVEAVETKAPDAPPATAAPHERS
jgi:CDP-diacylglycerol--serine O-phosphatidyltransferase